MNTTKAIGLEPRTGGVLIEHDAIPTFQAQPVQEEPGVSIRDYLDLLWESRKTLAVAVGAFVATALLYLLLVPPTYKADALLRIDKNKALLTATLRSEGNKAPAEAENPRAQREAEILRSRSVLGKVVQSLNLAVEVQPVYFPLIRCSKPCCSVSWSV